jgi:3-oxoadipate enol-lactonase/4-carboxymuconolactone decarboxylase
MVAMQLAATSPERVGRVALVCTSAHMPPERGWRDRAAAVRAGGMAAVLDTVPQRWFTPAFAGTARAEELRKDLAEVPAEGYAGCCEAIAAMDLRPMLPRIRADVLVVAGAADEATPPAMGRRIVAGVLSGGHRARLEVVDHAAHLGSVEQGERIGQLMLQHFDGENACAEGVRVDDERRHAAGMEVRRAVLGDAHVDRAGARTTPFTADFQDLITRYAWGDIWTRPGLDRRTRSCITLAMLATLNHDAELGMHVRAALRNGLTPEDIKEVLLQVAIYAGVPAANRAFAVAQEVLVGDGVVPAPGDRPAEDAL